MFKNIKASLQAKKEAKYEAIYNEYREQLAAIEAEENKEETVEENKEENVNEKAFFGATSAMCNGSLRGKIFAIINTLTDLFVDYGLLKDILCGKFLYIIIKLLWIKWTTGIKSYHKELFTLVKFIEKHIIIVEAVVDIFTTPVYFIPYSIVRIYRAYNKIGSIGELIVNISDYLNL